MKSILRLGIIGSLIYFMFANLGIVLFIFGSFFISIYLFVLSLFKQTNTNTFKFKNKEYTNYHYKYNQNYKQNFNDNNKSSLNEISKAKEFFDFKTSPNKEQIKKKYKELAKIYHPDINKNNGNLMKDLNHYKEILLKHYS